MDITDEKKYKKNISTIKEKCINCVKHKDCETLCISMATLLEENGYYSEATHKIMSKNFDSDVLDYMLYNFGLTKNEEVKVRRIIIALLTPEQKAIISLIAKGKNQIEIGKILNISQSAVSQKLKTAKKEMKNAFIELINYVLES